MGSSTKTKIVNEEDLKKAFAYAKNRGFPHYDLTIDQKNKEFETFKLYNISNVIEKDNTLKQTFHCMGLCWSYFPHHWAIKSRNMKTPVDVWQSDDLLLKALRSRIKWGGKVALDGKMSDSDLRKAIRSYSGVQRVSNFRPSAAAAIYQKYCLEGGKVWDMSSGFGGRLIGAIRSKTVSKYYGNDPSTLTYEGLLKMASEFNLIDIDIKKIGSEFYCPNDDIDLCFTSPPYFNTEIYSDDKEQSCHMYKTTDSWNESFLKKTIQNCKKVLKNNGKMILNVANVVTHKTLENDTVRIATEEGFVLKDTMLLKLSTISYKGGHKHEPVFVFELK